MTDRLTPDLASKFAALALAHLTREYPNKLTHALAGPQDVQPPRALHPIFYGSYDWHSCVHGYWLVLRVLERYPALPEAARIVGVVDAHFTDANVAGERAYLALPHNSGFERPYGWAWLLALCGQLERLARQGTVPQAARWAQTMAPLAELFVSRFEAFLPKATYPLRVGTHFNTAFALSLALDFARDTQRDGLAALIVDTAQRWHLNDVACQAWGAVGRRVPVACADGSRTDAARAAARRLRRLVRALPAGPRARRTGDAVRTGHRQRPQRRQDRASRRT